MYPMYSAEWFETFATARPPSTSGPELDAISGLLPLPAHARVLDVGCGVGRIAGPLALRGYAVTGIDVSVDALTLARERAPGPTYVALDQRHVGRMRWRFDAALVLWNSLGFVGRDADVETLTGLAAVVRPGGRLLFDLYHPEWMREHPLSGQPDPRGASSVRRWVAGRRCFHEIRYPSGRVDEIQFDLYLPQEFGELARFAGLEPGVPMTWWTPDRPPCRKEARYQVVCTRPA